MAHCVHLEEEDIEILAKRKSLLVYCPASNMKLGVCDVFPFRKLKEKGALIALGTDGVASNNNLDMLEEMKIGALLQKHHFCRTEEIKAKEIFESATKTPASFLEIKNEIKEGDLANLILVDLTLEEFFGGKDIVSHLVYAANYHCIRYLIFNGEIIYQRN